MDSSNGKGTLKIIVFKLMASLKQQISYYYSAHLQKDSLLQVSSFKKKHPLGLALINNMNPSFLRAEKSSPPQCSLALENSKKTSTNNCTEAFSGLGECYRLLLLNILGNAKSR